VIDLLISLYICQSVDTKAVISFLQLSSLISHEWKLGGFIHSGLQDLPQTQLPVWSDYSPVGGERGFPWPVFRFVPQSPLPPSFEVQPCPVASANGSIFGSVFGCRSLFPWSHENVGFFLTLLEGQRTWNGGRRNLTSFPDP
jgi:hypothetical protein